MSASPVPRRAPRGHQSGHQKEDCSEGTWSTLTLRAEAQINFSPGALHLAATPGCPPGKVPASSFRAGPGGPQTLNGQLTHGHSGRAADTAMWPVALGAEHNALHRAMCGFYLKQQLFHLEMRP